jgi:mono/diheme cytochrome c family protein
MRRLHAFGFLAALAAAVDFSSIPATSTALAATPPPSLPPSPTFAPTSAPGLTGYYSFKTKITITNWPSPSDAQVHWTTRCTASTAEGKSEVGFVQGMTAYSGTVITTLEASGHVLAAGDAYVCSLLHDQTVVESVHGTLPPSAPPNQPATDVPTAPMGSVGPLAAAAPTATPRASSLPGKPTNGPAAQLTVVQTPKFNAALVAGAPQATAKPTPEPTAKPTPQPTEKPTPQPTDTPQPPPDGHALFANDCAGCHAPNGAGTSVAPRIAGLSYGTVSGVLKNPPQAMQGVVSHLSAAQLDAIAHYVSQM